jgi:transposase
VLENANENLTPRMRNLVAMLWSEWKDLELQIVEMNYEVERIASSDAACIRLCQIPGIGPLVATAIVASIGNGAAFQRGREYAAWMGLVPRQYSTGGRAKLYGISKRGNCYLRKILVREAQIAKRRLDVTYSIALLFGTNPRRRLFAAYRTCKNGEKEDSVHQGE